MIKLQFLGGVICQYWYRAKVALILLLSSITRAKNKSSKRNKEDRSMSFVLTMEKCATVTKGRLCIMDLLNKL